MTCATQAQVSAERMASVSLKGVHARREQVRPTPQTLQMTAVPSHVLPSIAVAVKDTCTGADGRFRCGGKVSLLGK